MIGKITSLVIFGIMLLLHAGCRQSTENNRLQVVASITPLAYFAERIGSGRISVSVMVPSGGDPHSYEPKPKQMVMLRNAILFLKAGSGIEFELDWMSRFLSLNPGLKVCDASEGIKLIPMPAGEDDHHEEQNEAHRGQHRHGGMDPHYWLSPANAMIMTRNIAKALEAADPAHREEYAANALRLLRELRSLDTEIKEKIAGAKLKKFLVFHPAWGYYAQDYGLEQIAVEVEGKSLTPRQMRNVIETAAKNRIRAVFISPQFNAQQADAIAAAIGGYTLTVDPLAADYQENLRRATGLFMKAGNE